MKLLAAAAAVVMTLMAALPASAAGECAARCEQEESRCVSQLGSDSSDNCHAGYRLCVQRCDPQRMTSHYLDSVPESRELHRRTQLAGGSKSCGQACALSGRSCVEAGNSASQCRVAQNACTSRCQSS